MNLEQRKKINDSEKKLNFATNHRLSQKMK